MRRAYEKETGEKFLMDSKEKRSLDRLLSGGEGPSVQEREEIFDHVMRRVSPLSHRGITPAWILRSAVILCSAACLMLIGLLIIPPPENSGFSPRGTALEAGQFQLQCLSGAASPTARNADSSMECYFGDTLVFMIMPPPKARYFSAAALSAKGILIWYFPSENQGSLLLPPTAEKVAERGIVIGNEHAKGRYRVFGVFSQKPLSQKEVRQTIEAYAAKKESRYITTEVIFDIK